VRLFWIVAAIVLVPLIGAAGIVLAMTSAVLYMATIGGVPAGEPIFLDTLNPGATPAALIWLAALAFFAAVAYGFRRAMRAAFATDAEATRSGATPGPTAE
jgi:hypothetical protein